MKTTLEEAAEMHEREELVNDWFNHSAYSFKKGANWQSEQSNQAIQGLEKQNDELRKALEEFYEYSLTGKQIPMRVKIKAEQALSNNPKL